MHTEGRLNLIELDILGHYKSSEFNNLTIGLHFVFAHLNLFTKMFNSASKILVKETTDFVRKCILRKIFIWNHCQISEWIVLLNPLIELDELVYPTIYSWIGQSNWIQSNNPQLSHKLQEQRQCKNACILANLEQIYIVQHEISQTTFMIWHIWENVWLTCYVLKAIKM